MLVPCRHQRTTHKIIDASQDSRGKPSAIAPETGRGTEGVLQIEKKEKKTPVSWAFTTQLLHSTDNIQGSNK
jgi:hypothetical protein